MPSSRVPPLAAEEETEEAVMGFSGFTPDVLAFYAELRANNAKEWWTANKARYERNVHEPMLHLPPISRRSSAR
jgi:hypothetical protein